MGSGYSNPAPKAERHPLGLNPSRTNNADTGKVLPYFCGQARMGVTWLGNALNQDTKEVVSEGSGGKGGGDENVSGYDYYADCAGVVCLGLVDKLREIWMDKERVWRGELLRDSSHVHSANVTIEGRGQMTIYWGTEGQTSPAVLEAAGHPAYRGMCYLFFEQLYFGQDKTNAPDIEVVIERSPLNWAGAPVLTGNSRVALDAEPIHALVDALCHPRGGFGFAAADLDLPHLAVAGAKLRAEGNGISPFIDDEMTAGELVETFCQYCDAWPSFRDGNKLRIVLAREPETVATTYALIGEYDLVDTPRYATESMAATVNKVAVEFTNWQRYFEKETETNVDTGNYALTRRWRAATLDRPWITSRAVALRMARNHARLQSVPKITVQIEVRAGLVDDEMYREARDIVVGSFVRFTYADYNQTLLLRVVEKRTPRDRSMSVRFKLESDRYQDAVLGYQPDDVPGPDDDLAVDAQGAADWQIVELPMQLVQDDPGSQSVSVPWFGVFAARKAGLDARIAVWASRDGGSYNRVVLQKSAVWAVSGTLVNPLNVGPLADTASDILITVPAAHADKRPATGSPGDNLALWRGDYLLYIDGEWIAYREAYASHDTGTDTYYVNLLGCVRARFGSPMASHASDAKCWMIARKNLKAYTNAAFRLASDSADNDVFFKLTAGTRSTWFPLGDVTAKTLNVVGITPQPVPPANLRFFTSAHTGSGGAPATAALTWDTGADPVLSVLWEDRAWQRNAFFASWLKPYRGEHSYVVTVRPLGWVDGDAEYQLTKLAYPADVWTGFPGTRAHVITAADVVAALGSLPDVFSVSVVSVWRAQESLPLTGWVVVAGTSGVAPSISDEQPLQFVPSGLRRLVYSTDPELSLDSNFSAVAAHWSISFGPTSTIKPVAGQKPKGAKARTVANFTALQAWVRANLAGQSAFTLYSLTGVSEPERVIDANFELLNTVW